MGVLNVTTDSFFDGGKYVTHAAMLAHAEKMLTEGADFIDVGGYSSRPGADDIPMEEERNRVVTAVAMISKHFPGAIVAVDTFRSAVAQAAIDAGASMINDISAGNLDLEMLETISRLKIPYIVMHMRGDPRTMSTLTQYAHVVKEVIDFFHEKTFALRQLEVNDIIIDPGFGFSKTLAQNFELLHNLDKFSIVGPPILVGLSRKSMIWKTLDVTPADALIGTTALNAIALLKGANILRVHDVKEAREVVKLFTSLQVNVST